MKLRRLLPLLATSLATPLLLTSIAHGDTVRLKDGRTLEGRVVRDGPRVVIESRLGQVTVLADDVASIAREVTADEELEVEQRLTVMDDPVDVARLAAWCRERGLLGRARQLDERARGLRESAERAAAEERARARDAALAARREGVRDDDGEGLYRLAQWAEGEAFAPAVVERLLREALLADPEHARARVADELRRAQAAALEARRLAEQARDAAQGELDAARAARRQAERQQAAAEALAVRLQEAERTLDDRRAEVARREAVAREAEQRAEAHERQARDDAARVAIALRELEAERCRLEAERRALAQAGLQHAAHGGASPGWCSCGTTARPTIYVRPGSPCGRCGLTVR